MSRVLVALSDDSLGGTSRSALECAKIWEQLGWSVTIYNYKGFHKGRERSAKLFGIIEQSELGNSGPFDLVHLHHKIPRSDEQTWVKDLFNVLDETGAVPVITHNIFGRQIGLNLHRGRPWVEGTLGSWSRAQLIASNPGMWIKPASRPIEVPNPQDPDIFRLPTDEERRAARQRIFDELTDQRILLRVGSPTPEKWSLEYIELVAASFKSNVKVCLIGVPTELKKGLTERFRGDPNLILLNPMENDLQLRELYWAADGMSVYAERGESFGNVIFESLMCGTPVTYRKSYFRDNTPVELKSIGHFQYATSCNEWIDLSLSNWRSDFEAHDLQTMANAVSSTYGLESVAKILNQTSKAVLKRSTQTPDMVLGGRKLVRHRLTLLEWLEVLLVRNPAALGLHSLLSRVRSLGQSVPKR